MAWRMGQWADTSVGDKCRLFHSHNDELLPISLLVSCPACKVATIYQRDAQRFSLSPKR